ncbi:MAG TPA: cell division protein SepF [Acidimicrobiia bacterium]|jgi:cell division inhibitor SepF
MASMWRRAMVYLGLQDDDELDYGGEYETYGDYGDAAEEPQAARPRRESGTEAPDGRPSRDSGTVRTRPTETDYATDYGADYGAPAEPVAAPAPAAARVAAPRQEPLGMSAPRPSVVRTIGPTTAARVHVVEPQGFNDAQEVGDRLKANQPVILNLQGLPRELQRRLIDFSSGLAYAVAGNMQRVANQVFLLTPSNVEVSQEEKERLQARGLFQP